MDAKIDSHIKENPKYWAYIQDMPRERLERTLVLNEVRELDRQQRMKEGILKQLNKSPSLKAAYETVVKDLPEDQREGVMTQLARQAKRAVARSQSQQQGARRRHERLMKRPRHDFVPAAPVFEAAPQARSRASAPPRSQAVAQACSAHHPQRRSPGMNVHGNRSAARKSPADRGERQGEVRSVKTFPSRQLLLAAGQKLTITGEPIAAQPPT